MFSRRLIARSSYASGLHDLREFGGGKLASLRSAGTFVDEENLKGLEVVKGSAVFAGDEGNLSDALDAVCLVDKTCFDGLFEEVDPQWLIARDAEGLYNDIKIGHVQSLRADLLTANSTWKAEFDEESGKYNFFRKMDGDWVRRSEFPDPRDQGGVLHGPSALYEIAKLSIAAIAESHPETALSLGVGWISRNYGSAEMCFKNGGHSIKVTDMSVEEAQSMLGEDIAAKVAQYNDLRVLESKVREAYGLPKAIVKIVDFKDGSKGISLPLPDPKDKHKTVVAVSKMNLRDLIGEIEKAEAALPFPSVRPFGSEEVLKLDREDLSRA